VSCMALSQGSIGAQPRAHGTEVCVRNSTPLNNWIVTALNNFRVQGFPDRTGYAALAIPSPFSREFERGPNVGIVVGVFRQSATSLGQLRRE
jgi:hypothetical protein